MILALDLYFRGGQKQLDSSNVEVIKLSQVLNNLLIHETNLRNNEFRNPQGVSMKLGNFLSIDPQYEGKGLSRGGKLDKIVWDEFSQDISNLRKLAFAIEKGIYWLIQVGAINEQISEEFAEGRVLTRIHNYKERNSTVVKKKKESVLRKENKLVCEACSFDFAEVYGELGYGFAECHHTVPLSKLEENHKTVVEDLAILCANCHRIIHRSKPMLSVKELREAISKRR